MEYNEGTWYISGCAEDSPSRLFTAADLLQEVKKTGFIPLFANEIPGFSVEERTTTSSWWTGDPETDPWEWRILLSRDPDITYGKFFYKRAGFVSKEWFPVFANYRRNGYDFEALVGDELASYRARKIMDALELDEELKGMEILSPELKEKAGFGKNGQKNYEGVVTDLQMQTYLIVSDFQQKKNKRGENYGWHIAVYATPETKWGYDHIASGYHEDPKESWKKIVDQVKKCASTAGDQDIEKLLGIRYPGESVQKKKEPKPKPEKALKPYQYPYPAGLFMELGVHGEYSDDQLEGLKYALEQLHGRERDVILSRYQGGMTFKEIGICYNLPAEWIRTIHNRAVRKIKEREPYYKDGYVKTLVRLKEEQEQRVGALVNSISEDEKLAILRTSVYDMDLSARTTNCLINAGLYTIEDILVLLSDNPAKQKKVRNLVAKSYDEILKKLSEHHVDVPEN